MSDTHPVQASALRIGQYVMVKEHPCKIVSMSTSKTGKHGHAKIHLVGLDIFNGSKHELSVPSTHNTDVPTVTRTDYQLLNIDDTILSLLDDKGETKEDLDLPDDPELSQKIKDAFEDGTDLVVSVIGAVGQEKVVAYKENKQA